MSGGILYLNNPFLIIYIIVRLGTMVKLVDINLQKFVTLSEVGMP